MTRGQFLSRLAASPRGRWALTALAVALIIAVAITLMVARRLILIGVVIAVIVIAWNALVEVMSNGKRGGGATFPPRPRRPAGLDWIAVGAGLVLGFLLRRLSEGESQWALLAVGLAGIVIGMISLGWSGRRGADPPPR